jgi:flavin-dependent dehydrogenase
MVSKNRFDVFIVGAGPAGLICGRTLALYGKRCLILEIKSNLYGKVCGDGISSKCVQVLKQLDISPDLLISVGGHPIHYNISLYQGMIIKQKYEESKTYAGYSIGISRDILADILLDLAIQAGCEICFNTDGKEIRHTDHGYVIANAWAQDIIIATGAATTYEIYRPTGTGNHIMKYLPVGISSRIVAYTDLSDDAFYFLFGPDYTGGYAWAFPLGNHLWNIGTWSNLKADNLRARYNAFVKSFIEPNFKILAYDRVARGAVIGALPSVMKITANNKCIGDCALTADFMSGEGISYAMLSGYEKAVHLLHKSGSNFTYVDTSHFYENDVFCFGESQVISHI